MGVKLPLTSLLSLFPCRLPVSSRVYHAYVSVRAVGWVLEEEMEPALLPCYGMCVRVPGFIPAPRFHISQRVNVADPRKALSMHWQLMIRFY